MNKINKKELNIIIKNMDNILINQLIAPQNEGLVLSEINRYTRKGLKFVKQEIKKITKEQWNLHKKLDKLNINSEKNNKGITIIEDKLVNNATEIAVLMITEEILTK